MASACDSVKAKMPKRANWNATPAMSKAFMEKRPTQTAMSAMTKISVN